MPCSMGNRPEPEDFPKVRRRWSRKIKAQGKGRRTRFLERYEAGDREGVWDELHTLDLRRSTSMQVFDEAEACVRLTMKRVRSNIEHLARALAGPGYEFRSPEHVHVQPTPADLAALAVLEELYGPLPLTLRLFYEEVGSVDFRQNPDQMVRDDALRATASPLLTLGEHDPLFVTTPTDLAERAACELPRLTRPFGEPPGNARLLCWLAPDEFHKANYSGGEDYHVYLPEPAVDFPFVGVSLDHPDPILANENQYPPRDDFGPSEFFLSYLRRSFLNGGFRGQSNPDGEGPRLAPQWEPLQQIAAQLLAV